MTTRSVYQALRLAMPAMPDTYAARTLGVSRERIRQIRVKLHLPRAPRPAKKVNHCWCGKEIAPGCKTCWEHRTDAGAPQGVILLTCEQCKVVFPRRLACHLINLRRGYKHFWCGNKCKNSRNGRDIGSYHREQTHCKRGHEFTPENTQITSQGSRCCRACNRLRHREHYVRKGA